MPKLLIIMKHGEVDNGIFAQGSKRRIRKIAKHLQSVIGGRSAKLLTAEDEECALTARTANEILQLDSFESKQLNIENAPHRAAIERLFVDPRVNRFDVYLVIAHELIVQEALRIALTDERLRYTPQRTPIADIPFGGCLVIDCVQKTVHLFKN